MSDLHCFVKGKWLDAKNSHPYPNSLGADDTQNMQSRLDEFLAGCSFK